MNTYTPSEKQIILETVDATIKFGLEKQQILPITLENYPQKLRQFGASFVTLEIKRKLRGCIGSLEAYQPLIQDITQNSYAAAFNDPRFYPLTIAEYPQITKHISILSPTTPITFTSEKDLLQKIKPGIDGLILNEHGQRGTFLPAVWESLPTPELFFKHLKLKAGLSENYWSNTLTVERYTVEVVE